MSFWKILAGAAIGVGAVAAAPFTGGGSVLGAATLVASLSGAGTAAAAVGAGVVGGAVGASIGDGNGKKYTEGYNEGQRQAKAETDARLAKLSERLEKALARATATQRHFDAILAMHAVAISCAHCDGEIHPAEISHIEMFITGIAGSTAPEDLKQRICDMYEHPPGIQEAFECARDSGVEMSVFDDIIDLVIQADGVMHDQETVFLGAWRALRAA